MNISNIPKEGKCTGCHACEQICKAHAIAFVYDDFGFLVPTISGSCTQCGLCSSVCQAQSMKSEIYHKMGHCYIAYAKDKKGAYSSASGGAFFVIASKFLEKYKGKVYGCYMDEQFNVVHTSADDINDLALFQGSKYVQSNTQNSYYDVEKNLREGKQVLYTGTPCQIAGLKMYLKREWSNLYTIDLICHGVPSQLAFGKYIKYLETVSGKHIQSFRFRNRNAFDASGYLIKIKYKNGTNVKYNSLKDLYFRMFSKNMSLNRVCYQCKFAKAERVGDITIGDSAAAGILGLYRFEPKSSIMINTEKGNELWDLIKDELVFTEIEKEIEIKRNKPLSSPGKYSEDRDAVCKLMAEGKFSELSEKYPNEEKDRFSIHTVSAKVPMFVKKPVYSVLCAIRDLRKTK